MEIKCVIFDMDGTLLDSEKVYLEGYRQAFEHYNMTYTTADLKKTTGQSGEAELVYIDSFTNDRNLTLEIMAKMIDYVKKEFYELRLQLKPGAVELLAHCQSKSKTIGLATSSHSEHALAILQHFNIDHYFDLMIFGDQVEIPKPHPMMYEQIVEKSGFLPAQCLIVEDSYSGVKAANGAGVKVIQLIDDMAAVASANVHVQSLNEVIPLI